MSNLSRKQQRELLEMQAELARLRIASEYLKKAREQQKQSHTDSDFSQVWSLAEGLPSSGLLWKTVFLPLRWKHRIMAALAILVWQMWRNAK